MKTLIATAVLLAFASPGHAAPYQEGMRDYREGLCYRARPYPKGADNDLWERGYYAQQKKEHNKRYWSFCHGVKEKH